MTKKLGFEVKQAIVGLSGACFWYWKTFHSFLQSCGVPQNIIQRYPKGSYNKYDVMRNTLEDLETAGKLDVINAIISTLYKMRGPIDPDGVDIKRAKNLLVEFRELVGNDPIETEIQRQNQRKARQQYQTSIEEKRGLAHRLNELNQRLIELSSSSEISPQNRGFELERLFFDLLALSEFQYSRPYRTDSGEQIDGHFSYDKFDYLVEVKWTESVAKQPDLAIFDAKIRGKAQSTRGLFLSANDFDRSAIGKFSGDSPRIVLMTGEDLALILNGQIPFDDAMKAKVDAIVRKGKILLPVRSLGS